MDNYYHIGIGFTARPYVPPTNTPLSQIEIMRGRQHNPDWTLLVEPTNQDHQPFTTRRVSLYGITFDSNFKVWRVFSENFKSLANEDDIDSILYLGCYHLPDINKIDEMIKSMPGNEGGYNPSGYSAEWYSATWVIRVLHELRRKYQWCHFYNIPTSEMHGRVLQASRFLKAHLNVGNRTLYFGALE
ncbi:hypothetical protein CVT24_009127 [Panaeolus cyanescens]|uniref:Uncharacterized protein n=1 Tax=Panaeolus cyanescens TaxID=181874 RepID=A0A409VAN0_9AGAR|nr:hypothetical protein CVT24_009127 [Panaeolus cyanescens]